MLGSVRCAKPPTLSSHLRNLTALLLDGVFKHHTYDTITITTISMGKNKNKRKRGGDHHQSSQRRHKKGFWIDTCRESSFKRRSDLSLTVWITQVNLTDNHVHVMSREKEKQDEAADVPKNRLVIKESVEEDPMTTTKPSALPPEDVDQEVVGASSHQASAEQDAQSDKPEMIVMTSNRPSENTASADKPPGWQQAFISIQRAPSAKEAPKKFPRKNFKPLPHGDCGDGIANPHSHVDDKFWAQRKRLFDRFDDGIQLDNESWYSVTPQAIANHIADRACVEGRTNLIVLDAFCGCGGNAIAFAARDEIALVVCVDIDRKKLEMAAHNATIYGIPKDKLLLIHDNAINILESIGKKDVQRSAETELCCGYRLNDTLPDAVDCIFLSPPWGGTDYASKNNFTLAENVQISSRPSNETINGEGLLERAATLQRRVIYFLPRNINGIPLGRSAIKAGYSNTTVELEMNMLNDKFKTVTAYFGMNAQEKVEQGEVKPEASSHQ